MPRPRGHRLSQPAFDFALNAAHTTITDLAEISGIPRATISALRGGYHGASQKIIGPMSDALMCPAEVLFPTLIPMFAEVDPDEAAA